MTRALCSRTSKRKTVKTGKSTSQESIPEEYKENSPLVLSQSSLKNTVASKSTTSVCKENISSNRKCPGLPKFLNSNKEHSSPVRRSVRRLKLTEIESNEFHKTIPQRNVLCDKTNSTASTQNKSNNATLEVLRTIENKSKVAYKLVTIPKPAVEKLKSSSCLADKENNVPVYKTSDTCELAPENLLAKKEAVYEFEVDENEEPVHKKKRKKRVYTRKPKIGPKALTINNIKYGSSESLVSLPEKSVPPKNRPNKSVNLKSYTSVTNLNDNEETCYSVKSFMSHPPSLFPCKNKNELSVLYETESEQSQNPINNLDNNNLLPVLSEVYNTHVVNPSATPKNEESLFSHNVHFSPNPRCYISKRSCSANDSFNLHGITCQNIGSRHNNPHQVSSCTSNKTSFSRDFLSSTPCKRSSLVVCNNSVFDDSYDLPQGLRPSTGFINNSFTRRETSTTDNCFGFDEPEELEEPLVSPIKNNVNIDLIYRPKCPMRDLQPKMIEKPSIKEVIEMLKATIPKAAPKKPSDVFDSSPKSSTTSSPSQDKEMRVNYRKPPRRSYERQRRIRHHSEHEEESEKEDNDKENTNKEEAPKAEKKCYKKINSKTAKQQKIPKAKLRNAKEEEEMERLAAQMNAQFQEIEKMSLVVE